MARSRRRWTRRRNSPPFKAWGLSLTLLAALLGYGHEWRETALVSGFLVFYLLVVRLTRCRVETVKQLPCGWRVRGLLGTCDYHIGYKRSLPRLVRGDGFLGLPTFMWPRDDFARGAQRNEQQPKSGARGMDATAGRARRPGYDWVMLALTAVGVLVAIVALAHDVAAS